MTFITCTIHVDGAQSDTETYVNEFFKIEAVEKGMTPGRPRCARALHV